mmetsp:Transcript_23900/g.56458  ORF Transcript_23900/g.56458 Transcript_23900/m.56458 type:complete len:273 (+) Transcript_23900:96-914(+)
MIFRVCFAILSCCSVPPCTRTPGQLRTHVGRHVDFVWEFRDVDLETRLDLVEDLLVLFARDKRNGDTLSPKTSGTTDTVQELVTFFREVVVDNDVDTFDIDTTAEQVRRYQDTSVEVLEGLILTDTFLLLHSTVDTDRREVTFSQQTVQFLGTRNFTDEDNDLVELECVKQVVQLTVLVSLVQLGVVQAKTVQGQLGFVVDVDLHRVLTELLTDRPDLLRQCRTEKHDLFLVRCESENFLNVTTHVKRFKDAVAFIEDEVLDTIQLQVLLTG